MQRRRSLIRRWTLAGIFFGALFPAAGWVLAGGGHSFDEIAAAHAAQSVLWIVDLAPLVLGIAGSLIGTEYAQVDAAWRATDEKVKERTAELSDANRQLEGLMRSKDQFVATVSHEVKNPLTVVLGFADELRDALSARGDVEYGEIAELIGDQSREINTNPIRYGGERISVVVRSVAGTSSVCVCDNGPGIPEDERNKVFEAYQQGRTNTPVSGSVGLGLNVSRQLARLMGGDLTYRYEGGVSTFALGLPSEVPISEASKNIGALSA